MKVKAGEINEKLYGNFASKLSTAKESPGANMKHVLQIFRDGKQETELLDVPLLDAAQGNMETLDAMAPIIIDESLEINFANTISNKRRNTRSINIRKNNHELIDRSICPSRSGS